MDFLVSETLKARYLREGEKNWEDVCERVAKAISMTEEEYLKFKDLMVRKIFLPSSPTFMNAGTEFGQLAACFVIPVEDGVEEIFDSIKTAALIQKTGGGTGFDFSKIRPCGSPGLNEDDATCGPVAVMKLFNEATEIVKQFGRRRGANMGILNISHNDILSFIRAKQVEGELSNFNISVMVPDAFMELVEADRAGEIWNRQTGVTVGQIFTEIVEGIWRNGEPGILFYDRINRDNFTPAIGDISATNPCGEEPLLPFESCNLGSINLSLFVVDEKLNWDFLRQAAGRAIRFLDNEIDKNTYPVPEIEAATKKTRKVGLGVMGFHDMLLKLGLPYDSEEALVLGEKLMEQVTWAAIRESRKLATEKGPFPEYEDSTWELPIRNATLTAVAPTGTISILASCSAGIEPVFSWVYRRTRTVGREFMLVHPYFKAHFKSKLPEADYNWLTEHVYKYGTLQNVDNPELVNKEEKRLFRSALDIDWKAHIDVQAAFQRHCHAGISKTINMPDSAGKEDIRQALIYAWKNGLKGLTIYRTGSRQLVVLNLKNFKTEL
ncbi:adenosylcobalamin-dependent ribonucleoside-diphosphate reductase [Methanosarcina sp. MSH10X1]|uniref:adenosylcobalamin-dependent ribonucleoside-diphosphate reductase n=1 Tax=Methanosarcina sp. MSH10X1 TaxID=2507075 RepID=UPI001F0C8B3E|nr:adenosylcobalamin-dependent ribonucleoside-diphosphate reductase [Methanosarcina sp. MSH10X1]